MAIKKVITGPGKPPKKTAGKTPSRKPVSMPKDEVSGQTLKRAMMSKDQREEMGSKAEASKAKMEAKMYSKSSPRYAVNGRSLKDMKSSSDRTATQKASDARTVKNANEKFIWSQFDKEIGGGRIKNEDGPAYARALSKHNQNEKKYASITRSGYNSKEKKKSIDMVPGWDVNVESKRKKK